VYGPVAKNLDLVSTLGNLGDLEMEVGNYDRARSHVQEALEMKHHVYGPEAKNLDLASTLCKLGILEKELGNDDKAREKLDEALAMAVDSLGEDASNHRLVEEIRKHAESCGEIEHCCAIL
jgi:tetratricopeptide (TPR) repeat protein